MKLMFLPVTKIDEVPHFLLYYNFSRKQNRYFLSPYEVEISKDGSEETICNLIRSSNFLCTLLDIDPSKEISSTDSLLKSRCMFYSATDLSGKENAHVEFHSKFFKFSLCARG